MRALSLEALGTHRNANHRKQTANLHGGTADVLNNKSYGSALLEVGEVVASTKAMIIPTHNLGQDAYYEESAWRTRSWMEITRGLIAILGLKPVRGPMTLRNGG